MIRLPGAMRLITAWQIPTHSFPSPKSVSKTIGRASGIPTDPTPISERRKRSRDRPASGCRPERALFALREQRLPVSVGQSRVDGIGLVRLAGEVDPRQLMA